MLPKLPSRAALLVPVLSLGLLVPGIAPGLTQADSLPTPCELQAINNPADESLLLLSAILPADSALTVMPPMTDSALAVPPPLPAINSALAVPPPLPAYAPPPPQGIPVPAGQAGSPKPGADLRPPEAVLLNNQPIAAVRQLRESLSEKQQADLRAVLTKYQGAPRQVGVRPSGGSSDIRSVSGGRTERGTTERETVATQASVGVQRVSDQIDKDIEQVLTPAQRTLLEQSRPQRLRSELPESTETVTADVAPSC